MNHIFDYYTMDGQLTSDTLARLYRYLTINEIADLTNKSERTIGRWINKYNLYRIKPGERKALIRYDAFNDWDFSSLLNGNVDLKQKSGRPYVKVKFKDKAVIKPYARILAIYISQRDIPQWVTIHHSCFNPSCKNIRCLRAIPRSKHQALHKGKIKLPESLVFRFGDYLEAKYPTGCIKGKVPAIQPFKNFPTEAWETFLDNVILAKPIMAKAMELEKRQESDQNETPIAAC